MIDQLKTMGIQLKHIDIGGGLGVTYKDEVPPTVFEYANAMKPALEKLGLESVYGTGTQYFGKCRSTPDQS